MSQNNLPIIIIGAGLAGLTAARELEQSGFTCHIVDQNTNIGGKVQTDFYQDQYYLDHGFQVLLPAYPLLNSLLKNIELPLCSFNSGAILNVLGKQYKVADPLRQPFDVLATSFGKYGTYKDKILILKLKYEVANQKPDELISQGTQSSIDFLKKYGFSDQMIENFWVPFFSGIFLESDLQTNSGFLMFLYKMFSETPVAVPAKGIGQLTQALQKQLKATDFTLSAEVEKFDTTKVQLKNGKKLDGQAVINTGINTGPWGYVSTMYFSAPESPINGPWLYLNSKKNNYLVNHVAVMTEVSPLYTTNTQSLISVNVVKKDLSQSDFNKVTTELAEMFGTKTKHWQFIKSYQIPKALPLVLDSNFTMSDTPSQQGALTRGHNLAQEVIQSLHHSFKG